MKTPKRFEQISSFQYMSIIVFFLIMVWALDGSGFPLANYLEAVSTLVGFSVKPFLLLASID